MKTLRFFFVSIFCILMIGACSTPAERASKAQEKTYKAQESIARERLDLVEKYTECVKKAGNDKLKIEACDTYLKAAEALK